MTNSADDIIHLSREERALREDTRRREVLAETEGLRHLWQRKRNRMAVATAGFVAGGFMAAGAANLAVTLYEDQWARIDMTRVTAIRENFRDVCGEKMGDIYKSKIVPPDSIERCLDSESKRAILKESPLPGFLYGTTLFLVFMVPVAGACAVGTGLASGRAAWGAYQAEKSIARMKKTFETPVAP
jgi:hypothetical protein